jgi:uncharacterized protein (DUF433 family)
MPRGPVVTESERRLVARALRQPRGRYVAERASQLSGIPARTLHDWAAAGVLVPDWGGARPRAWSYRDVVYVRLLAWLRSKGMDRASAAARVAQLRVALAEPPTPPPAPVPGDLGDAAEGPDDGADRADGADEGPDDEADGADDGPDDRAEADRVDGTYDVDGADQADEAGDGVGGTDQADEGDRADDRADGDVGGTGGDGGPTVHSDGHVVLVGDEALDRFSGQQAFAGVTGMLDAFSLTDPVEGVSRSGLWGPSLVRPSRHTTISPWTLGGEPCVAGSRVPTALLRALRVDRGLVPEAIGELYPFLSAAAIADALALEERLRAA